MKKLGLLPFYHSETLCELIYVSSFCVLDWSPAHNGDNIITAVGQVTSMDMGYRLPIDINAHPFSKYTGVYFKDPEYGVRKDPIPGPLTRAIQGDFELTNRSVSLFKLVWTLQFTIFCNSCRNICTKFNFFG